ncbi:SMI1/KNR4 family protein [Pseudomonas graminis]|uniref:SMI1 / KNR4 family (SUKH-1) n=1 Tax=Pseudomonas graminis TaxID=158627 RepID=A0A1I0JTX1_9PSED|nr:SMI1/KNR4 family protein [Pseudomonas graminis]SEU13409.1 SMI1 / KNR4 family (SUKH-1) [Pseudomonas graminis]
MNIEIKSVEPYSDFELSELERYSGVSVDDEIRKFFNEYNGARFSPSGLQGDVREDVGVSEFLSIAQILIEVQQFRFRSGYIPIALAEGGNYVVIDLVSKAVLFLDHEVEDGYREIAADVDDFVKRLIPNAEIQDDFSGMKVKSVWIDPVFLARIKSGEFK